MLIKEVPNKKKTINFGSTATSKIPSFKKNS